MPLPLRGIGMFVWKEKKLRDRLTVDFSPPASLEARRFGEIENTEIV